MTKKLLIIDDNKEVVEVVSLILTDLFGNIDSANTVDEAEELLSKNVYDLIFLDINLENRNGAEVVKFLIEASENPNKASPFVIISGIITPQFVDRYQKRFAGILMKPFEHDDVLAIVEKILNASNIAEPIQPDEVGVDEIPFLKCDLPFPIIQLDQRVNKILDQVRKSPKLKQLFAQLKVDRTTDNYVLSHIGILINISTAICINMEWNTDKTLEKFVYASYLHDMALSQRPDLARINTSEALEAKKESLSPSDYKLILEHPNIASNSIAGMREIPQDVDAIIRQHHELPKGTGYPLKIGHQKISPLSVVFIIAHDLTEYILANPKWKIEDYVEKSKSKFQGAHFIKILRSLANVN
ncbi:MAG: response regulator [Bacteriovorax sp.]|nr:response regulator [Bacteriovorax sp.]